MSKPYDATTKQLIETRPNDWPVFFGLPVVHAEVIDADAATVTAAADRVLRVEAVVDGESITYLLHIEFQASYDAEMGERLLRYNVLLRYRHRLPVYSVVVLLRREADGAAVTGTIEGAIPGIASGAPLLRFTYGTVRLWELSADDLLRGGVATLPFALLTGKNRSSLPDIVRTMKTRIDAETTPSESGILWSASYILLGLRYPPAFAQQLLRGVQQMRESSTYQAILSEGRDEGQSVGRAAEARALIRRIGEKRLGAADASVVAALDAIASLDRLEQMADRLLEVENWEELLR